MGVQQTGSKAYSLSLGWDQFRSSGHQTQRSQFSSDQVDIKLRGQFSSDQVDIKLRGQFSSDQVDIKLGGQFSSDQVDIKLREVSSVQTKLTSKTPQQFRSWHQREKMKSNELN